MPIELKVPEAGESITEIEIGDWQKRPGDSVTKDEPLVALESDKATMDLAAPVSGTLTKVLKEKGQIAKVGEVIAHLEPGGGGGNTERISKKAAPKKEDSSSEAPTPKPTEVKATAPAPVAEPRTEKPIIKQETNGSSAAEKSTGDGRPSEVVRMSRLRRTVAARLVEAQHQAALLTTFNEIDMGAIMDLRKSHGEAFLKKYNTKLGFMSFFVKACVDALKLYPSVNAEVRGEDIMYHNYFDIGIAIGGGKGLVVPVLRNAERLSFAEIEAAIAEFGARAKANTLKVEELQGGTFTITNGGIYGSMLSTPIINPPQSGILGMHAIQDRPVARDGNVVIRPIMYAALTYDHRIVDGREAVSFLKRVKDVIENPSRMLMEV